MYLASFIYEQVDYLPWMYFDSAYFIAAKPSRVSSFMALVYPADYFTWISLSVCSIAMLIILSIIQKLWSHASGEPYLLDYLYEGNNLG